MNLYNLILTGLIIIGASLSKATPRTVIDKSASGSISNPNIDRLQNAWRSLSFPMSDGRLISGFVTGAGGFRVESFGESRSSGELVLDAGILNGRPANIITKVCATFQQQNYDSSNAGRSYQFSIFGVVSSISNSAIQAAIGGLNLETAIRVTDLNPSFSLKPGSYTTAERSQKFISDLSREISNSGRDVLNSDGSIGFNMTAYQDVVCDLLLGNANLSMALEISWEKPKYVRTSRYEQSALAGLLSDANGKLSAMPSRDANIVAGTLALSAALSKNLHQQVEVDSAYVDSTRMGVPEFTKIVLAMTDSQSGKLLPSSHDSVNTVVNILATNQRAFYVDTFLMDESISIKAGRQ